VIFEPLFRNTVIRALLLQAVAYRKEEEDINQLANKAKLVGERGRLLYLIF
jgi:hypothetical protein